MKNKLTTALAGAGLALALALGAAAAPAAAATANYYRSCGAGWAAITATNYYTGNSLNVKVYNASTGAYVSQITIGPGQSRNWITSVHNARFYLSGVSFGANTWCS